MTMNFKTHASARREGTILQPNNHTAAVSLIEAPANHRKASTVAKEVMAIMLGNKTGLSIEKFLESHFAGKHPKRIKKAPRRRRPKRQ
jgi:hypothetical protein